MKGVGAIALIVVLVLAVIVITNAAFVVTQTNQAIVTQFGKPIGTPVSEPGLHWKMPFTQKANYFEKRFLEWDGDANEIPTKDKKFIWVDTYARWRISDPLLFFQRLRDEQRALTRLSDILNGETRNAVANHDLVELVRSTNREFQRSEELGEGEEAEPFQQIKFGRDKIRLEILQAAKQRTPDLGIELLDLRFKRTKYVKSVRDKVYERMITERKRIASRYRSEGQGEAARIRGEKERELKTITSEAYRKSQEIIGAADAEATRVYAQAYNRDPEFYRFLKSMESYKTSIDPETTLVLTTGSEYLSYLQGTKTR